MSQLTLTNELVNLGVWGVTDHTPSSLHISIQTPLTSWKSALVSCALQGTGNHHLFKSYLNSSNTHFQAWPKLCHTYLCLVHLLATKFFPNNHCWSIYVNRKSNHFSWSWYLPSTHTSSWEVVLGHLQLLCSKISPSTSWISHWSLTLAPMIGHHYTTSIFSFIQSHQLQLSSTPLPL